MGQAIPSGALSIYQPLRTQRSSSAWYFDDNGDFVESPIVQDLSFPRLYSNVAAGTLGIVWELAGLVRTDYQDFTYTGIDGESRTVTLYKFRENSSTDRHDIRYPLEGITNDILVASFIAKDVDRRYVALYVAEFGNQNNVNATVEFDLQTATVSRSNVEGSGVTVTGSVTSLGDGLYQCFAEVDLSTEGVSTVDFRFGLSDGTTTFGGANGQVAYAGDGESSAWIGCPMITPGTSKIDWVSESNTGLPRIDYDPATGDRLGLMAEGASTNLFLNSEDASDASYNNNGVTIGTPTTFATNISLDQIVEDSSTGLHYVGDIITTTIGNTYTYSVLLKYIDVADVTLRLGSGGNYVSCAFDIQAGTASSVVVNGSVSSGTREIRSLGGGVYRCSVSCEAPAASCYARAIISRSGLSYAGDGSSSIYAGAHQFEELPFASSYIPTTTAQVTRAAETHALVSLDPWYRASGYSVAVQARLRDVTFNQALTALHDGDSENSVTVDLLGSASDPRVIVEAANVAQATIQSADAVSASTDFKVAARIAAGDFAASVDGNTAITDTSGSLPAVATTMVLGQSADDTLPMYGWIQDFRFTTELWSDAELATESGTTV